MSDDISSQLIVVREGRPTSVYEADADVDWCTLAGVLEILLVELGAMEIALPQEGA